jgi:hypothetical protein
MHHHKSCIPQEPFSKLEENGKASILNYNLPQATCYDATSFLGLDIDPKLFKANQLRPSTNDFWDIVPKLPREELLKKLKVFDIVAPNIPVLLNPELLKSVRLVSQPAGSTEAGNAGNAGNAGLAAGISGERAGFAAVSAASDAHIANKARLDFLAGQDSTSLLVEKIKEGFMPVLKERFSRIPEILFFPRPLKADPQLSIVLHLKMCSYLGDYGAGRTVNTFSLLPGEKTTITIRSYLYKEEIRSQAQNVLDSYSESSAEDLQTLVENEVEHATSMSKSESHSKTGNWKAGGSAGINLGFFKIGGGGGGGGSSSSSSSVNQALQTQVSILTSSTSRHTSRADSLREVEVNTSTKSTQVSESEELIVRELENPNDSRVLNFVFRQLLQEFISLTYVHDVSFIYSNGFPSQRKSSKLSGLEDILRDILVNEAAVKKVKEQLYTQLCSIVDFEGKMHALIEKVAHKLGNCIQSGNRQENLEYVRVKDGLKQTYRGKTVNGIILDATHRVIRTPSLVVDALLGQGEALDCFNTRMYDENANQARLQNEKLKQAMEVINGISDPVEKAKLYQMVFGSVAMEQEQEPEKEE